MVSEENTRKELFPSVSDQNLGMYEPHGTRTILNELFGRLHSRKIFDLIFPIILIDEHNPSELINNATREACKFANIDLLKYLVENHSNVIDRDIHLHSAVSGIIFIFLKQYRGTAI